MLDETPAYRNLKKFKKWVKSKVRSNAFNYLIKENESKEKTKNIKYKKLNMQNYFKSARFTNSDIEVLLKLRSRTLDVKANFPKQYFNRIMCQMPNCYFDDSQEHLLISCEIFKDKTFDGKYIDIFSKSTKKQSLITKKYAEILEARREILNL